MTVRKNGLWVKKPKSQADITPDKIMQVYLEQWLAETKRVQLF